MQTLNHLLQCHEAVRKLDVKATQVVLGTVWQWPNPVRAVQCTRDWHAKLWGLSAFLASVCQAGWVLSNHLKLNIPKSFLRDRVSILSAGLSQAVRLGWGEELPVMPGTVSKGCSPDFKLMCKVREEFCFYCICNFSTFFLIKNLSLPVLNQSHLFSILWLCFWQFLKVLKVLI